MALDSVLASIPGYGGFAAKRQANLAEERAGLQDAVTQAGLLAQLQKQQQAQQAAALEKQYRAELAAATTPEEQITVASKYAGPEKLLTIQQGAADRKAQREIMIQAANDRRAQQDQMIDLRYDQLAQTAANDEQRRALEARRIADKAAADKRHDETLRMLGQLRADTAPQPQIVQTDAGPVQVNRSGQATPIVGPDGQPVKPKSTEKALPASAAAKLLENRQNLRRAEQALALIEGKNVGEMKGDPNATGYKGFLPDAILQRVDPDGTDTRAMLADLGSLVIHDRSGAAVTAAEFPRLQPFIPKINDDPETVKRKLKRFAQVYREVTEDAESFYRASGFKVPESTVGGGGGGGDEMKAKVEAAGIPYEPAKYEYRVTADGKVQRRAR